MRLAKSGQTRRKEVGGETIRCANPNHAFERRICIGKLGLACVDRGFNDFGHALETGPGGRWYESSRAMLKKFGVQRVLEARNAARYRSMIDTQLLSGS